jgi:hypothetical protein
MVVSSPCRFVPFTFRPTHGRHPEISRTNFGGILHHSARLRKQKTLKILDFVKYVEDYPQTDKNTVFNPVPLDELTSVSTKTLRS